MAEALKERTRALVPLDWAMKYSTFQALGGWGAGQNALSRPNYCPAYLVATRLYSAMIGSAELAE